MKSPEGVKMAPEFKKKKRYKGWLLSYSQNATKQRRNQTKQVRGTKEDTAKLVVLVIILIKRTKAATQQQREGQKEMARPFF